MSLLAQTQMHFVNKRAWATDQDFIDIIAMVSMLPGPQAVNAIAVLGYRLRGWLGFIAALGGVVLPGFCFILFLWKSYSYFSEFEAVTRAAAIGVLPPLAAIIAKAALGQAKGSIKGVKEGGLAVCCLLALLLLPYWGSTLLVLVLSAAVSILFWKTDVVQLKTSRPPARFSQILLCMTPIGFIVFTLYPPLLPDILLAKVGAVFAGVSTSLFGGGLVVIPLLQGLLINDLGWLDQSTFNVALAASQLTPGPVLSVATFAGMHLAGFLGAVLATVGTYLPTAIISVGVNNIYEKFMSLPLYQKAMAGIRCAVVGLIAGAAAAMLLKLPFQQYPWQVTLLVFLSFFLVWRVKLPPYVTLPVSCLLAWLVM